MWYPLFFSSVCLQSYWFSPPRTLILEVCSATSSGCTMLIHLLSEISLAMHIWQLLYLVIFFNPSMRRSSLMPSQMLAGLPLSPQLKSQGLVSFSLKKVCTTSPFFLLLHLLTPVLYGFIEHIPTVK